MLKLDFIKYSPGGNPTILIKGEGQRNVSVSTRANIAAALMHPLHLTAEQVGYIDTASAPPRLEMMGGEFCLNATRCLVYEMWQQKLFLPLAESDDLFGLVESSGLGAPVCVRVKNGKRSKPDSSVECFITLDSQRDSETVLELDKGVLLVRLPGISHLLLDERYHALPEYPLVATRERLGRYGLLDEAACGVVWHRIEPIAEKALTVCRITPIIHVAATKSCVAETSCGSGTLALALAVIPRLGLDTAPKAFMKVIQPSAESIRLSVEPLVKSGLYRVELGGFVRLVARGETFIAADVKAG